ncbi:MAG: hypothetical protein J5478_00305 [Bacteroidales bacterium]|nr:hypothetical protein [Bacteroidales bacterium]
MKHQISLPVLLGAMVWLLAPLSLPSCAPAPEVIDITVASDYSQLVTALENVDASLSERMTLLEAAMESGLADNQAAVALVRQAVQSLRGDLEEKLAAVSEAVKSQGTSLETKLALIEAAISTGFADAGAQRTLLEEALASLGGSLEEKVAAVETAVKDQSTTLETKLGLIEAAVKDGLADNQAAQGLLKEAIASLGGTMQEKFAAIDAVLTGQQADLSAKLVLIETALAEGFAEGRTRQELMQRTLDSLGGSQAEKLAAIDSALTSQTAGLSAKLSLIEAALTSGFSSGATAIQQIQTTLSSLKGVVDGENRKIDAIITELGELDPSTGSVSAALSQIQTSVSGLSSYDDILEAIQRSLEYLFLPDYVDMGNGLKWATRNVGAKTPVEYGDYFAWGETTTKSIYSWNTYKWGNGSSFTKYTSHPATLESADDAATANWGGTWRTPTYLEWDFLLTSSTQEWTEYKGSGVYGILITSELTGNSIFLPAAGYRDGADLILNGHHGYYWASTLEISSSEAARAEFYSQGISYVGASRCYGASIRPVKE